MERALCDPCIPQRLLKAAAPTPPTQGAALRMEIEAKLRHEFERGAVDGRMTREQARVAGLGFIERHFDAIDRGHRGAITFDDYLGFLEARAARPQ